MRNGCRIQWRGIETYDRRNFVEYLLHKTAIIFITTLPILMSCNRSANNPPQAEETTLSEISSPEDSTLYKTENLLVQKLSNHCYIHTSYLNTDDFGRVPCNGMIVVNDNEAVVFDTPSDSIGSRELIRFIKGELNVEITAIIPTHFHGDCVGGIEIFHEYGIPSYASNRTIRLLKDNGNKSAGGMTGFADSLTLNVGDEKVHVKHFGAGHTRDNVIGYYSEDKAIFGGCLIKEVGAGKGYLGDAVVSEWPATVRKIKQQFPDAEVVIPGHGQSGRTELLDYTIQLFE